MRLKLSKSTLETDAAMVAFGYLVNTQNLTEMAPNFIIIVFIDIDQS